MGNNHVFVQPIIAVCSQFENVKLIIKKKKKILKIE